MNIYTKTILQVCFLLILTFSFSPIVLGKAPAKYYFQIKVYYLNSKAQEERVEKYLQAAYLPALHRAGIKKVGVFKPIEKDSLQKIYVFIPFSSLQQFSGIEQALQKDNKYMADGKDYLDAVYNNSPFERIEVMLLQAFEGMPEPGVPRLAGPKDERVYELRSYEGATENYYRNKVHMFNNGEIDLFKRLGFNAAFYAEVLSGTRMPNLMYMTCFDNKASREDHWKAFSNDAEWKRMSAMPEYQHNVSKMNIYFLYPLAYSDL